MVFVLITFHVFSLWYFVWIPWQWYASLLGLLNLVIFHFGWFMIMKSYVSAIFTDPGRVIPGWIPSGATEEELKQAKHIANLAVRTPIDSAVRYCKKCENFKPPRSHHCNECKRCVLKMDHHCPWVNSCVGYFNHKSFVLFLAYCSLTMSYAIVIFCLRFVDCFHNTKKFPLPPEKHNETISMILVLINLVIIIPVTIGIISLFVWQFTLLLENVTTIEEYEKRKAARLARSQKEPYRWRYDFGRDINFKNFFGSEFMDWFFPSVPREDGHKFHERPSLHHQQV